MSGIWESAGKLASEVDYLRPNDARVQHRDARIGGYNYHYMLSSPANPTATVLLIHGFPDIGMAWRYQVPFLTSLNLRVIVPDMLGYGRTDAPDDASEYSLKKMSFHMKELVEHVCGEGERIILGGHDWGGAFVWRMCMWCPESIRAVFSLNTPMFPPAPVYVDVEATAKRLPNFGYQVQFASEVTEQILAKFPEGIRKFLNGMYGGTGPNGEQMFSTSIGVIEENLDKVGPALLMDQEMVNYYVEEFSRHGIHGPLNWYRTRKFNFEDEVPLYKKAAEEGGLKYKNLPGMIIMGEQDAALPPIMAQGNEQYFELPLKKEIASGCGHWAMWQDPETINKHIGDFVASVLGEGAKGKL